jgi:diaminohydroxyphosphoribosylaminopyrimidine deaminase/5-amino-6-(5-phosphoribosylamino)uracil reductase
MQRALELAALAGGNAAPNPMVGAVLVYKERIIGEGYHRLYGQPHAEVNCIHSVKEEDRQLIPHAVLYVTLEPCAHFGKTPPCADLIIRHRIPEVIIGTRDPFERVDGKGIEKLLAAGIKVQSGILEKECLELNKRFFSFHVLKKPYVVLKWAQTANGKTGTTNTRLLITHEITNRLVHKWRSEEMSILVGTNTALKDDPLLTNRLYSGPQPLRIVIDRNLRLPRDLKLFDGAAATIVLNTVKNENSGNLSYHKIEDPSASADSILKELYKLGIHSVFVEGGTKLLQSFIDTGLWDEARVITNEKLFVEDGIAAPDLKQAFLQKEQIVNNDRIHFYRRLP